MFKIGKYGKPYLLNYRDFQFNISHTKNALVVAVSDKSVGIDIEKIKAVDFKIAERFFVHEELSYIIENKDLQNKRFFEVWTKKEAYIKCIGKGLSIPLNQFNVFDIELVKHYYTISFLDYIISVFVACDDPKINLRELTKKEIQKMAFTYLL